MFFVHLFEKIFFLIYCIVQCNFILPVILLICVYVPTMPFDSTNLMTVISYSASEWCCACLHCQYGYKLP